MVQLHHSGFQKGQEKEFCLLAMHNHFPHLQRFVAFCSECVRLQPFSECEQSRAPHRVTMKEPDNTPSSALEQIQAYFETVSWKCFLKSQRVLLLSGAHVKVKAFVDGSKVVANKNLGQHLQDVFGGGTRLEEVRVCINFCMWWVSHSHGELHQALRRP